MEQTLPSWHSKNIPREVFIPLPGLPVIMGELPWQHVVASPDLQLGRLSFKLNSMNLNSELDSGTPH